MDDIIAKITQLPEQVVAGPGWAAAFLIALTCLLVVFWGALKKVAEEQMLPLVRTRFLRLSILTVLAIIALRFQLGIGLSMVGLSLVVMEVFSR